MKRFFFELIFRFEQLIGNLEFLSVINTISCLFKICLLSIFLYRIRTNPITSLVKKRSFLLIFISLSCAILCDFTWLVKLYSLIRHTTCDYRFILLIIRLAWIAVTINFHSLALFLEQICDANYRIPLRHYLLFISSSGFVLFFLHAIIFNFNCLTPAERPTVEHLMQQLSFFYGLFILVLPSFCRAWYTVRTKQLPIILKKQARIFMWGLVAPYWIGEFIQGNPFEMFHSALVTRSYALSGMSTLLFTVMLYFSAKKIMGFRFLNINKHVCITSSHQFVFINTFRGVIGQFGQSTSLHELNNIVQHFFKETFKVTLEKSWLYLLFQHDTPIQQDERIKTMVTAFLSQSRITSTDLAGHELLVFDEIEFSHFYEPDIFKAEQLAFLKAINADIALPIYDDKKNLFACVIVERHARPQEIYTYTEQDEITVFGKYLYNVITLLRNKKVDMLLEQKHQLEHDLYQKKQEIAQYKESIRSFIRSTPHKYIGVVLYKNRQFIMANQTARDLLPFDLNNHEGDQITKQLKKIATHVEIYKTMYTATVQTNKNNSLIIFASPHLEQNMVIITISHPDVSDVLREQTELLHNNNELDYLLYLSTTKLGSLINELIPFNDSLFLNFKVDLLKLSLSKKALLLAMPDEDMMPVVELLHHISSRTLLRVIEIKETTDQTELAMLLFGINPLLARQGSTPCLLEQLDNTGTLFLKNIDLATPEIQEHLAEFIKMGWYRPIKGSHAMASNVRIICSTHQNLSILLTQGYFNKTLYEEFTKTSLCLPSLLTLPEQTVNELTDSLSRQTVSTSNLGPLLTLNKREKTTLTSYRPASLHELRRRIHALISQKAKIHEPENAASIIPSFLDTSDPELIMATRLGKHALKDPHLMSMLWQKLNGNQNKIATLLGVNRSSVNRRCREYNLH